MRRAALLLAGLAALSWAASGAGAGDKDGEGTEVVLGSLKSRAPADWKKEEPAFKMRAYQFKVPRAEGDKVDAQMLIFHFPGGAGGSAADNIDRWKGMWMPPEGKKLDEVAKVEKFKVGTVPVTYLDVHGTYLDKTPPFDPNAKTVRRPNYRQLAVVFESEDGPYFIRLTGPERTVEQHKKGFDNWLKAFK
jgi:hypothetical protein